MLSLQTPDKMFLKIARVLTRSGGVRFRLWAFCCALSAVLFLPFMAAPAYAAPNACDAVQSRIRILKETLRKTTNKGAVARLQNEINKLSKDQARLCKKQTPAKPEQQKPAQATGSQQRKAGQATRTQQQKTVRTAKSQQQKSPRLAVESGSGRAAVSPAPSSRKKNVQEKRAVQRPQTIVQQPQAVGGQGGQRGFRHPVGAKTIPVTGHILFAGGSTSTFYGRSVRSSHSQSLKLLSAISLFPARQVMKSIPCVPSRRKSMLRNSAAGSVPSIRALRPSVYSGRRLISGRFRTVRYRRAEQPVLSAWRVMPVG